MRIIVISAYPDSRDSNSLRARSIAEGMKELRPSLEIRVASDGYRPSESDKPLVSKTGIAIARCWNRNMPASEIIRNITRQVGAIQPDLAIFHYNTTTFGNPLKSNSVIRDLLKLCRIRHIRTLVVMHSVIANPMRRLAWGKLPSTLEKIGNAALSLYFDLNLKQLIRNSDRVVFPSLAAYEYARNKFADKYSLTTKYIPLGMLGESSQSSHLDLKTTRTTKTVSSIGYLSPYKGLENLILAFNILRKEYNVKLNIIGSGVINNREDSRYASKLRLLADRMRLNGSVNIRDEFLSSEEMEKIMRDSDLLVYPFIDDGVYGMSGSVYESLDKPSKIVVTNSPRFSSRPPLIGGGIYCADYRSYSNLYEVMRTALESDGYDFVLRSQLLEQHSLLSVSLQYLALVDKLFSEHYESDLQAVEAIALSNT